MPLPSDLPRLTMGEAQPTRMQRRRPSFPTFRTVHRTPRPARKKVASQAARPRLTWQVGASLAILLCVGAMRLINLPATNQALEGLDYVLSASSMPENFGGLQFVQNWNEKAVSVFSAGMNETHFTCPGTAYAASSDKTLAEQNIFDVTCGEGAVECVADGQVFYVGSNEQKGPYLIVRHAQGYESVYWPVTAAVKTGQSVLGGQKLGEVAAGAVIHCQVLQDGKPIDPAQLFEPTAQSSAAP